MNRLLTGMIQVIQEVDTNTGAAICNEFSCPTMSAGRSVARSMSLISPTNKTRQVDLYLARKWSSGEDSSSFLHYKGAEMDRGKDPRSECVPDRAT